MPAHSFAAPHVQPSGCWRPGATAGAAVAVAAVPPPPGNYTMTGACNIGCTGTVETTLTWKGLSAGSTLTVGQPGATPWLNLAQVDDYIFLTAPIVNATVAPPPFGPQNFAVTMIPASAADDWSFGSNSIWRFESNGAVQASGTNAL